jgi:hypothetical protein
VFWYQLQNTVSTILFFLDALNLLAGLTSHKEILRYYFTFTMLLMKDKGFV